jgi:hypothetical protein
MMATQGLTVAVHLPRTAKKGRVHEWTRLL